MTSTIGSTARLSGLADTIRQEVLEVGNAAGPGGAHFGPALSLVEVMAVLYGEILHVDPSRTQDPDRDRLILSKGHGSLALYAALHATGFVPDEVMATCEHDGSRLPGQPIRDRELGIEYSSGSLGMGLSYGVGLALSARMRGSASRIFVVMGDGETNEGSVWEAAMSASHFALGNLTAIVDCNAMQSDGRTDAVLQMDHANQWAGAGWRVLDVHGHDTDALAQALSDPPASAVGTAQPTVVLARTVKGRGISFMEHSADWHHGALTADQLARARAEVAPGSEIA